MSQNLNLLRQNYCRPATVPAIGIHYLFPLERECEEGKALLAKTPKTLLQFQKFNAYGLQQTYRDEATGTELPVFAVFDLEDKHQFAVEVTTDSVSTTGPANHLRSYIPFQKTQASVRKINERRRKAELVATRISSILGIFPVLAYLFSHTTVLAGSTALFILVGGWAVGAFLSYLVSLLVLDRFCPWKKLVISAEFNGILPKETRETARAAKDHFDKLHLIVDEQHRWKSTMLPDPRPRALDPLLIGELKQGGADAKFFLIHQFDLTEAEQYLADEFATK